MVDMTAVRCGDDILPISPEPVLFLLCDDGDVLYAPLLRATAAALEIIT